MLKGHKHAHESSAYLFVDKIEAEALLCVVALENPVSVRVDSGIVVTLQSSHFSF